MTPPTGDAAPSSAAALGHLLNTVTTRLFVPDEPTPCQQYIPRVEGPDTWFAGDGDLTRIQAIAQCRTCPFAGRCGYNAVATGATDGVWGGVLLPGNYPRRAPLQRAYQRLLTQFENRRHLELGDAPVPPLPAATSRKRRNPDRGARTPRQAARSQSA